ncbi:MAG: peptidoglycan-binding protein [Clostridia bacterium]|nr:peptidoglycan-binding protein [Clostridia bacterium]
MKKACLLVLSFVMLIASVLTVTASAETYTFEDDMFDDDSNYHTTEAPATNSGSLGGSSGGGSSSSGILGGNSEVGGFVGEVVSKVFDDEDVSEGVGSRFEGVMGVLDGFDFEFGDFVPTTGNTAQTTGSNFFDTIDPVVSTSADVNTGSSSYGSYGSYTPDYTPQGNYGSSYATTPVTDTVVNAVLSVNPYTKPTTELKQGDEGDGVKWLQWILSNTDSGFQGTVSGEYDDATAAAVKNLQLKYNLNVDGNASLETIEKAEQMYNELSGGGAALNTTVPAPYVPGTTVAADAEKKGTTPDIKVTIIIVILIIVWIFALAAIFIIIHIKRKKLTPDDVDSNGRLKKGALSKNRADDLRPVRQSFKKSEELRESETLQSLSDEEPEEDDFENTEFEENEFEVISEISKFGFTDAMDDDDTEITLSSLYEMKQRKSKQKASEAIATEDDNREEFADEHIDEQPVDEVVNEPGDETATNIDDESDENMIPDETHNDSEDDDITAEE